MQDNATTVKMYAPDQSLKHRVSPNGPAKALFPVEAIKTCEQLLATHKEGFYTTLLEELQLLQETLHRTPALDLPFTKHRIATLCSRAEAFGFPLVQKLLTSLMDYLSSQSSFAVTDVVLQKHLEALHVVAMQHIEGEGGLIGKELLESIAALIHHQKKAS